MRRVAEEVDVNEDDPRVTLERTGKRPLMFEGELVDEVFGATGKVNRWHDVSVYKTRTFKFVVLIQYQSTWDGEIDHSTVEVADTPEDVARILEEHDPISYVQGFPPISSQHVLKQEALLRDIRLRYLELVSRLLSKMPGIEEVVD